MRTRNLSFLMLLLTLGACQSAGKDPPTVPALPAVAHVPVALTPEQSAIMQAAVRDRLIDPLSAIFSDVQAAAPAAGGAVRVCGWINSKNRLGGYVGKQPFTGVLSGATFSDIWLVDGDSLYQSVVAHRRCRAVGIELG